MANGQWGGFKTVVSDNAVAGQVDEAKKAYPRLAEAWDALEWLLARSASSIGRAPNSGDNNLRLYVQADDRLANVPAIWVVYEVGEQIDIIAVKIVPPSDEEDA